MSQQIITSARFSDVEKEFFRKSHELVFSQLKLTPVEHDLLALMLSRLSKEHWLPTSEHYKIISPRYEFGSEVISEWLGVQPKNVYSSTKVPAKRLAERSVGILNKEKKEYEFIPLLKRVSYKDGILTMVPNDELLNEYINLTQGYSRIPQKTFRTLNSDYAKRLFSILCRFQDRGRLKRFSFQELYAMFGLLNEKGELSKKSYKRTAEFIRSIIKPAIREIDEKESGISFHIDSGTNCYGYKPIQKGRTFVAIEFLFSWNEAERVESNDNEDISDALKIAKHIYSRIADGQLSEFHVPSQDDIDFMMSYSKELAELGLSTNDIDFLTNLVWAKQINTGVL